MNPTLLDPHALKRELGSRIEPADDRFRWAKCLLALLGLAALLGYGLAAPGLRRVTGRSMMETPERFRGQEALINSVRVVELLSDGAFLGESAGLRAVFRGAPQAQLGEECSIQVTPSEEARELLVKVSRPVPEARAYRWLIFLVSAVVALGVAINMIRRFRWAQGALQRRIGNA